MRANLNFPRAVARNHLVRVDRIFELAGIAGDPQQPQCNRDNIVGERGHRLQILHPELPILPQAGVEEPDRQLRQFVELDGVPVVEADIAEPRKVAHQPIHQALAAFLVIELR